jgi:hypothetical protein
MIAGMPRVILIPQITSALSRATHYHGRFTGFLTTFVPSTQPTRLAMAGRIGNITSWSEGGTSESSSTYGKFFSTYLHLPANMATPRAHVNPLIEGIRRRCRWKGFDADKRREAFAWFRSFEALGEVAVVN